MAIKTWRQWSIDWETDAKSKDIDATDLDLGSFGVLADGMDEALRVAKAVIEDLLAKTKNKAVSDAPWRVTSAVRDAGPVYYSV